MSNIIGKSEILSILKNGNNNNAIRLPSMIDFKFNQLTETLSITMAGSEPSKNMQTDGSAIEGWILVMYHYLNSSESGISVKKIELEWEKQTEKNWNSKKGFSKGHYYRFLYRVAKFKQLFEKWFSVASELENELYGVDKVFAQANTYNENLVLNVIGNDRRVPKLGNKEAREVIAEYNLANDDEIKNEFMSKFKIDLIERQIPTGLFSNGEAKKKNRVFTGGASAIDLIGINTKAGTAKIFELKLDNNAKVGVISELFFYACVIEDFIAGRFNLAKNKDPNKGAKDFYDKLKICKTIEAHILTPSDTHILISDSILNELNEADSEPNIRICFKVSSLSIIKDASTKETPPA